MNLLAQIMPGTLLVVAGNLLAHMVASLTC